MKVLAFGEILWDIIDGAEHLGGAPFNFAAHSAQCGNESYIVSRLGRDGFGKRAYELSKRHGVHVSFIQWDETYPTGIVDVTLTNGQPDYFIRENAAWDFIQGDGWLRELKNHEFDVFYFGSLAQRSYNSLTTLHTVLRENKFRHIFYDVNLRKGGFTTDIINLSLNACTILKLNVDEAPIISKLLTGNNMSNEQFCSHIKSAYPNVQLVIITASERGCFIYEDKLLSIPGSVVKLVDAVGAGDAFSASFMHVYDASGDASKAAHVANQIGAYVATHAGAIPDYTPDIYNLLRSAVRGLAVDAGKK